MGKSSGKPVKDSSLSKELPGSSSFVSIRSSDSKRHHIFFSESLPLIIILSAVIGGIVLTVAAILIMILCRRSTALSLKSISGKSKMSPRFFYNSTSIVQISYLDVYLHLFFEYKSAKLILNLLWRNIYIRLYI